MKADPLEKRSGVTAALSVLAMLTGGAVYVLWRPKSLVMFAWFDSLGLSSTLEALRAVTSPVRRVLPIWVIYSLPQALWLLSGLLGLEFIWGVRPRTPGHRLWLVALVSLAFGIECGQYVGLIPGRFDRTDVILLLVVIAGVLAYGGDNAENAQSPCSPCITWGPSRNGGPRSW